MHRTLRCYVEGRGDQWEAVCLDLDIAVQGHSLQEVYDRMQEAIEGYVAHVLTLPTEDQKRLLNRPAPLSLRLKFLLYAFRSSFWGRDDGDGSGKTRAEYLLPATA